MDPQTFMDIATVVTKLKMYPYFDISNYILMCMMVREDNPTQTPGAGPFNRRHPLACWIASMLLCFAGGILANVLVGDPIIAPFKDHEAVITASVVWYLINYSPFDIIFKITKFLPVKIVIYLFKEIQRTHKIHHAILWSLKLFPGSYVVAIVLAVIKGAGYYYMRIFERMVRGFWIPSSHEFLQPSFVTKGSIAAGLVFILERQGVIDAPHAAIYFGVVLFFIYFRLSSLLLGIHDPFLPFENLFCAVFMGGMWDAMKRAISGTKKTEGEAAATNDVKSNADKKRD